MQSLPNLLRGDGLQIRGFEDPVDDGRVLRFFGWKYCLLIRIYLFCLRGSREDSGGVRQLTRHLALVFASSLVARRKLLGLHLSLQKSEEAVEGEGAVEVGSFQVAAVVKARRAAPDRCRTRALLSALK